MHGVKSCGNINDTQEGQRRFQGSEKRKREEKKIGVGVARVDTRRTFLTRNTASLSPPPNGPARRVRALEIKAKGASVHTRPRADCVTRSYRRVGSHAFYFTAKRYRYTATMNIVCSRVPTVMVAFRRRSSGATVIILWK